VFFYCKLNYFCFVFWKFFLPNLYKQTNKGTRALPYALAGNKQTNNFCELFVNVNKIFGSSRMSCGGKWSSLEHLLGSEVRKRVFRGFCGWVSKGWGGGGFRGQKFHQSEKNYQTCSQLEQRMMMRILLEKILDKPNVLQ